MGYKAFKLKKVREHGMHDAKVRKETWQDRHQVRRAAKENVLSKLMKAHCAP